jgi:hypothetical protein
MSAAGSLSFPARIKVRVPIDKSRLPGGVQVPVQVTVLPDNAGPTVVLGTSDDTIVWMVITGTR